MRVDASGKGGRDFHGTGHVRKILLTFTAFCVLLMTAPSSLLAQRGGAYDLTFSTVDAGGGTSMSSDGRYSVTGTIGQIDAGAPAGNEFEVLGGYWGPSGVTVAALSLTAGVGLGLLMARWGVRRRRR